MLCRYDVPEKVLAEDTETTPAQEITRMLQEEYRLACKIGSFGSNLPTTFVARNLNPPPVAFSALFSAVVPNLPSMTRAGVPMTPPPPPTTPHHHFDRFTKWQEMSKKRGETTTLGILQLRKSSLGTIADVVSALQVRVVCTRHPSCCRVVQHTE